MPYHIHVCVSCTGCRERERGDRGDGRRYHRDQKTREQDGALKQAGLLPVDCTVDRWMLDAENCKSGLEQLFLESDEKLQQANLPVTREGEY